jgi:prepilin-type N-terminal cleavage/methylation domain-containing protein
LGSIGVRSDVKRPRGIFFMSRFHSTSLVRICTPSIRFVGLTDRLHAGRRRPCLPGDGFSVIELLITIVLLGVVLAMATPGVRGYIDNSNLKAAARTISGDIAFLRESAMTEYNNGTKYCLKFDTTNQTISLMHDDMSPLTNYPAQRNMSDFGSGIQITNTPSGTNPIKVYQRGFIGTPGNIEITNNRGSRATITMLATGRVYVTYSMQ